MMMPKNLLISGMILVSPHSILAVAHFHSAAHYRAASAGCQIVQSIEAQGTAEPQPFDRTMLNRLLDLASGGIGELLRLQGRTLE